MRYDAFTGRVVIVARGRRRRPHLYRQADEIEEGVKTCPFCPGRESETPRATLLYVVKSDIGVLKTFDQDGSRRSDWSVRVFPNAYPALTTGASPETEGLSAYGYHEVIVENPDHLWSYEKAELSSIELSLMALMERGRFMESDGGIKYVAIFKNQGREAGASITHPHFQMIGSAFVPPLVAREMDSYSKGFEGEKRCHFCALTYAANNGGRLVFKNDHFAVITPFASMFPYECWIVPRRHVGSFLDSSAEEVRGLAVTLKVLFSAYRNTLGNFPFNMAFHSRTVGGGDFHWHLEIYPRVAVHAGFELGSGAYINVVEPEEAALQLRQSVPTSGDV